MRKDSRNEPGLSKLVDGKTEQEKFQSLTMRLKYEAWKALVLQIGVFRLRELLNLVRPWEIKSTKQ